MKELGRDNIMTIPRLSKVTVNVGVGRIAKEEAKINHIIEDLKKITGQKPAVRKARKSIAGFKLREGMDIGLVVTLRGRRMYDFIDKLINIALPRSRDFYGIKLSAVDQNGNLNVGIKEQSIFPEISYESIKDIFGFQVTITTTAKNRADGLALFRAVGFPLVKSEGKK